MVAFDMDNSCQLVVFSDRAYNAIIREAFDKDPVETGGILLGHILNNGIWIVIEAIPPGINCIFERAYFEYDENFVNYLAQKVANQYQTPLQLLGLWHRHPGSMDVFSTTDDVTNKTFASLNPNGAISGLVNIDPNFRLTMYHLPKNEQVCSNGGRPLYHKVEIEVGDDIIPEQYLKLRYYNKENDNIHPSIDKKSIKPSSQVFSHSDRDVNMDNLEESCDDDVNEASSELSLNDLTGKIKRHKFISVVVLTLLLVGIFFFVKITISGFIEGKNKVEELIGGRKPQISEDEIELVVGESESLKIQNISSRETVILISENEDIADVSDKVKVLAKEAGTTFIKLYVDDVLTDKCKVVVSSGEKSKNVEDDKEISL